MADDEQLDDYDRRRALEDELTLMIGGMTRSQSMMESELRGIWNQLVGLNSVARHLAPDAFDRFYRDVKVMLQHYEPLDDAQRAIALEVVELTKRATEERNRVVHALWMPHFNDPDAWVQLQLGNKRRAASDGGEAVRTLADVSKSVEQLKDAALRAGFLRSALMVMTSPFESWRNRRDLYWRSAAGEYGIDHRGFVTMPMPHTLPSAESPPDPTL